MTKTRKLLIVGDGKFAEIAYEYFTYDSEYEVVGFSAEKAFLTQKELYGLPVVPFEEVEQHFKPGELWFYAAITFTQLNRVRERLYKAAKAKGYKPASYISSRAFVWRNVQMGEHNFIFEDNTVQPFMKLGSNIVLWSGNHLGHHGEVKDHVFISSHVVVAGYCEIGEHSFLGVNASIANNVKIGADNFIGLGVIIAKDTPPDSLYKGPKAELAASKPTDYFKVPKP